MGDYADLFEPTDPFYLTQQDFDQYGFQTDGPNTSDDDWNLPNQDQDQDLENV